MKYRFSKFVNDAVFVKKQVFAAVPVQMLQQGFEGRPVNFRQTLDKRGVLLHSLPLVLFICGIHTKKNFPMKWMLEAQKEVIFCLNLFKQNLIRTEANVFLFFLHRLLLNDDTE